MKRLLLASVAVATSLNCLAEDWPMWRYDAARTAASTEQLPAKIGLQWERKYSPREQVWDDPLNHDLMPYDKVFEPVVLGDKLFVGFNDADKLVAFDLESGREAWTFYTGGPVRLPPAAWKGKVYFTSDDGYIYCVNASNGRLVWSFRGGPSERKALGNGRIISAWPARGGVMIRDGRVHFAASIWPFMGTFIYALDARTGKLVWVNDGTGADFIKQPHAAAAFAGVAPQGTLVASGDTLLVPGGRSVPAAFELATGKLKYFNLSSGGKGNGGSFVAAGENYYVVHTRERGVRVHDLKTGKAARSTMNEPVIVGDHYYTADVSTELGPVVRALGSEEKVIWEVKADGSGDLIKAGDHLYAAGKDSITAIALPKEGEKEGSVSWSVPVQGEIARLLAANGKLIAVTVDGRIQVYGESAALGLIADEPKRAPKPSSAAVKTAKALLAKLEDKGGFGLVFGTDDSGLIDAILANSQMHLTVVEPDKKKVSKLRRQYDLRGIYGKRISVHEGDPISFHAPPYIAHMVIIGGSMVERMENEGMLQAAYSSVRPYGGILHWPAEAPKLTAAIEGARLEKAVLSADDGPRVVTREGALPGSADWTHQYGNIGNTVKSDDARVRAPLGVLWFGGSSNLDVLPRHGHGPPEQVVNGRLFIEGMNSISARDVYTGRVIWKHDFKDLGTFGIYYNETYEDAPLSTEYNQKHIPGANGRGTKYVCTADCVYVGVGGDCNVLFAATGKLVRKISVREDKDDPAQWAFIGVYEDLLIAGDDYAHFSMRLGDTTDRNGAQIDDYSASAGLAVFDRKSGKLLWRTKARHSFLHNGIVAGGGLIYCLDKLTKYAEELLDRRGREKPRDYRLVAFNARTGKLMWDTERSIFGTWLGYSSKHDILLQAGAKASDRLSSEVGDGMTAYLGRNGKTLWSDPKRAYTGPCILHNELILTGANSYSASGGAFSLLTGEPHLVMNPMTGKMEPWRLNRTYGCNTIIASEHLLTFRSGAAGYYDLESMSGTGNLGGFKSGCTSNLVVANGVLNAPDYTRTCSCAYQNQTSLALIHMPDVEMWTYSQFGLDGEHGDRVLRAGINFGAPGNRRAPDGTLWLEYPHVGSGNAPQIGVEGLAESGDYFRRHSSNTAEGGNGYPWVGASGLIGEGEIVITPSLRRPFLPRPVRASKDGKKPAAPAKPEEQEPLVKRDFPPTPHTIRLYFSEPEEREPGTRVFSVALQGKTVIEHLDLPKESGSQRGTLMREFRGVEVGSELRITLTAAPGSKAPPVINGVEFIAEDAPVAKQASVLRK